ncbi:cation:proton antiporter subunit C [Pirellulaceae bacterium SH449]
MTEHPSIMYAVTGAVLVGIGLHGILFCRNLVRKVLALNLMGPGVFLVFIALGARTPSENSDPVPQAMVLTGIVVAVSATALMLALTRRLYRETGMTELPCHFED